MFPEVLFRDGERACSTSDIIELRANVLPSGMRCNPPLRDEPSEGLALTKERLMNGNWSRVLGVIGGAALIAGGFCLHEATMTRRVGGYEDRLGARATPWPICLRRDFPGIFLVAAASLTWIAWKQTQPRK
jgi:hypothetical protein